MYLVIQTFVFLHERFHLSFPTREEICVYPTTCKNVFVSKDIGEFVFNH